MSEPVGNRRSRRAPAVAASPPPLLAADESGANHRVLAPASARLKNGVFAGATSFLETVDAQAAARRLAGLLPGGNMSARHAANKAGLKRWLDRQRKRRRPLPANPRNPKKVDMTQVAAEAGIYREALLRERSAMRAMVLEAAQELGIAVRLLLPIIAEPRVCDLAEAAVAERRRQNRREGYEPDQGVRQIRLLCGAIAKLSRDGAKAAAKSALEAAKAGLDAKTLKLPRDTVALFGFVESCLERLEDGLPPEFPGALSLACKRLGMTLSGLARHVGMTPQVVINWAAGRRVPDKRNEFIVKRIEHTLGLKANTLVSRIRRRRLGAGGLPEDIFPVELRGPAGARERGELSSLLPAEICEVDEAERARLIASARARRAEHTKKRARRGALLKDRYALPAPWPGQLEAEWVECKHFKMRLIPEAGIVVDRRWSRGTASAWRSRFGSYFGFQVLEAAGNLRVAPDKLGFALLAQPKRAHAALKFKIERARRAEIEHGGDPDASEAVSWTDLDLLTTAASFFDERGWIRQSRTMRRKLGYADRSDARWSKYCDKVRAEYKHYEKSLRPMAFKRRKENEGDTQEAVLPILELSQPMLAVKLLLDGLEAERVGFAPDSTSEAKLLQDLIYVHVQQRCGFRPATSIALRYRSDNSGELRHDDLGWYLQIDKKLFKNAQGNALKKDFHRRLDDRWGFYALLERYLNWARPRLCFGLKTDSLFLYGLAELKRQAEGAASGPADERNNTRENILASRVRSFTRRHLGWNEETGKGIPGISEFGPTGFRHILATAVVKETLNPQLAADAIADSLEVTEAHYAHYLPSDREEKLTQAQCMIAKAAERAAKAFIPSTSRASEKRKR